MEAFFLTLLDISEYILVAVALTLTLKGWQWKSDNAFGIGVTFLAIEGVDMLAHQFIYPKFTDYLSFFLFFSCIDLVVALHILLKYPLTRRLLPDFRLTYTRFENLVVVICAVSLLINVALIIATQLGLEKTVLRQLLSLKAPLSVAQLLTLCLVLYRLWWIERRVVSRTTF